MKKKRKKLTKRQEQDKSLRASFEFFNDRFFGGEISLSTTVRFAKVFKKERVPADGHYFPNKQIIEIDENYRTRGRKMELILLHEMAHAWLYQTKGYVGYAHDEGHGTVFQGVLCHLFQIGAYDGLL